MSQETGINPQQPRSSTRGLLTGAAKRVEVSRLLVVLKNDLLYHTLSAEGRQETLEDLKIYGREPTNAEPIFTEDAIEVLAKHGLEGEASPASFEALRCLVNSMVLEPKTRQFFVDLKYCGHAAERLKLQDPDSEFLTARLLFMTTYGTNVNLSELFDSHAFGESINLHIFRHALAIPKDDEPVSPDSPGLVSLSETLKLLFNVINYYPHRQSDFNPSVENVLSILDNIAIPTSPLVPPIRHLINSLVVLNLEDYFSPPGQLDSATPVPEAGRLVDKLAEILEKTLIHYQTSELEVEAIALVTIFRKIYAFANEEAKSQIQQLLLPQEKDRNLPLGQSDSLSSRLLRLSNIPGVPTLGEAVSSLFFELSNKDVTNFVSNVGYGFAAGYLASHDLPVPESVDGAASSGGGTSGRAQEQVNPITGQKLSKEEMPALDLSHMTDEEKETEAEKLFVLFDRLQATGVMNVVDPRRVAVESGQFEAAGGSGAKSSGGSRVQELDDDDDDDDDGDGADKYSNNKQA